MIRRRVTVVIVLAMTIFSATATLLSALGSSPEVFAGEEGFVISSPGAPTIFSSRVDVGLADALSAVDSVTGTRPEVVAFSAWNGASFVVRGMDLAGLAAQGPSFPSADISAGDTPSGRMDALIGVRLMERLGIEAPFTMPLTGSYSARIELVDIVGSFESGGYIDDELLVSLEIARSLCGMPADSASLIHVYTSDPDWLSDVLSPESARFALYDIFASKTVAAVGESVDVVATVHNWGSAAGAVQVEYSEDGEVLATRSVLLNASSERSVSQPLSFDSLGTHTVDVYLSGDLPMNVSVEVAVVEPYMTIIASPRILLGSSLAVRVLSYDGLPMAGVTVGYAVADESGESVTDMNGEATVLPTSAGTCTLSATHPDFSPAERSVLVVDLGTYPDEFLPGLDSFTVSPSTIRESESLTALVVAENAGAVGGYYEVEVTVDSSVHTLLNISLGPAESVSRTVVLDGLGVGTHTVGAGSFSYEVTVEPWYADDPALVELVVRYGGSGVLSSSAAIPIYQAAKVSEGNVSVALFSVGAISALLSVLAISSVFAKEIREGRRRLGILRTIGASKSHIRRMVLPQSMTSALVGATAGVALGVLLALWMTRSGALLIFGHEFSLQVDAALLATVVVGAAAVALASSFVSAEIAARETVISSIRGLEPEPQTPADAAYMDEW